MATKIPLDRLASSLRAFGKAAAKAQVAGCRKAAQRGRTEVIERSKAARVAATGTYDRSWKVDKEPQGAILGNAAQHALFVEQGRRPGKAPPRDAIVKWMIARKMVKVPPKSRKTTITTKKGQANRTRASLRRSEAMERYAQIAFLIAMKIKWRGFKGRWILRDAIPQIRRWLKEEIAAAMKKVKKNPPKG